MSLIERLAAKEDAIAGKIEHRLGVFQRQRPILFRIETVTRVGTEITTTNQDLYVSHPYISKVPNKLVNLTFSQNNAGIIVTKNDYKVTLGRVPSINQFLEGVVAFTGATKTSKRVDVYINAVMSDSTLVSYDRKARILGVLDEDLTRWELILRVDKDE